MRRRDFMKLGMAATALATGAGAAVETATAQQAAPAIPAERPNILHFIVHDLGTALACYGMPGVRTPHLDGLAAEGVRFTHYYTGSTPCSPARGCIMTGRYAHTNGLIGLANRGWSLPATEKTAVDYFNEAGYWTANVGGQHERRGPNPYAYKQILQTQPTADRVADNVCKFLREYDPAKGPFYLNAYSQDVHAPWDRPEFQGRYNPEELAPPPYIANTAFFRQSLAQFYGSVSFMDEQFGRVLDCLRETGLDKTTLVSFTTDHGVSFPRCKSTLYDVGLSTALILRWPAHLPAGTTCDLLLCNIDLLPSYLELAGIAPSPDIQGRSFIPALMGRDYKPYEAIFAERNFHDDYDPIRSVRTDRYKYIRNFSLRARPKLPSEVTEEDNGLAVWNSGQPRAMEELYDLQQDPYEFSNVVDKPEYAETLAELRRRLDDWMRDTTDYMRGAKQCVNWPSDDKRLLPLPAGAAPKPPARQPARQPAKPAPPPTPAPAEG